MHLLLPQPIGASTEFPLPNIEPGRPLLRPACDLDGEDVTRVVPGADDGLELVGDEARRTLDRIVADESHT